MLSLLLAHAALAQNLPDLTLTWRRDVATLQVHPPAEEHIAAEAPATLDISLGDRRTTIELHGSDLIAGQPLLVPRSGRAVAGSRSRSLCAEDGSRCRVVDLQFSGDLQEARGKQLSLVVAAPEARGDLHGSEGPPDVEAAREQAKSEGKRVLLDFGAIWCPPCQVMAAELLDNPDDASLLDGLVVVRIDVDRPESFALKSRYQVGGYPTVVVIDPDGNVVDSLAGYPGHSVMADWLAGLSQRVALSSLPAPESTPPAEAARLALRLVDGEREEEARAWVLRAASDPAMAEDPHLREARLRLDPNAEDALWLATHSAPDRIWQWIFSARAPAYGDPDLKAAVKAAAARRMLEADGLEASDLAYVLADLSTGEAAKEWYAASAALLQGTLTGQPSHDRGLLTSVAELRAEAGDPEGAVKVLQAAITTWPEEFTYSYALAGVLLDSKRPAEAEAPARAALQWAYGDNRLRAANRLAAVLGALGRKEEAIQAIDEALASAVRPTEGIKVRTGRYLKALEDSRAELEAPAKAQ